MDVTTLNQLISVGGVLASTWLGLQVKNASEKENFSKKSISKSIVTEVFVPLLDALYPYNRYSRDEQNKKLLNLIQAKRELIPPVVLKQMEAVLENDDEKYKNKLLVASESFYNCYKKTIGYPYDSKMINKEFTPKKELRDKVMMAISFILGLLWILSAGYTVLGLAYWIRTNFENTASFSWISLIPVMFLFFGFPVIIFSSKS